MTVAEKIAKWEAELAGIESAILANNRWGETRRFAARTGCNRHGRRHWLLDHISNARFPEENKREGTNRALGTDSNA